MSSILMPIKNGKIDALNQEGNMELKDTIEMMNSKDYKERFIAEYQQTKIRYDKLDAMTVKYEAGTLTFTPKCSLELLKEQKKYMGNYIRCLKIRAEIEGIALKQNIQLYKNKIFMQDQEQSFYYVTYCKGVIKLGKV